MRHVRVVIVGGGLLNLSIKRQPTPMIRFLFSEFATMTDVNFVPLVAPQPDVMVLLVFGRPEAQKVPFDHTVPRAVSGM